MKPCEINFHTFNEARFKLYPDNPILPRFGLSPVVADPSVLTPDETHDRLWHLLCHTVFGIYAFESTDGIAWVRGRKILPRGMRPNLNFVDGEYLLYYERVQPLIKKGLSLLDGKWFSEIYLTKSKNLKAWTTPVKILGKEIPYSRSGKATSVSNPYLTETDGGFRLYFSAGLTYIEDCKFSEPTHISYAESDRADSGFAALEKPLVSPDVNSKYLNLCCGCIKVYKLKDCFIGLQNGIYADEYGKSHSAIMLLRSEDGKKFEFVKPLIEPQTCGVEGWMAQYVYACGLTLYENKLRIYFNARDKADALKGRENIGFAEAGI